MMQSINLFFAEIKRSWRRRSLLFGIRPLSCEALPEDLHSFCSAVNETLEERHNSGDWLPIRESFLWDEILKGEQLGLTRPGQTVLELGSGSGTAALVWAYRGYKVVGLDKDPVLVKYSGEAAAAAQRAFGRKLELAFFEGSYYLPDYLEFRNSGQSKAPDIEAKIRSARNRLHLEPCEDVYLRNGISLSAIDIFYAYLWAGQFPSVTEMISKYAGKNAVFLGLGPKPNDARFPEALGMQGVPQTEYFIMRN